jgi:glutamate/aspartate transport system substrate-binding protein
MKTLYLIFTSLALAVTSAIAQTNDTLGRIRETGVIHVGVRESSGALSYTTGNGAYVGFHVEICQRMIQDLERVLNKKLETRYLPVTSLNRIPLMQNGTIDVECGATTNNSARQKDVAFALTTYVEEVRMAVKVGSGINSLSQLNGRKVATAAGTTSVQLLRKHERAAKIDFIEIFGKDMAESFLLLESGRADAFVMDSQVLAGNIAASRNPSGYQIVGESISVEPIAIMLKKDDPKFKEVINGTIRELIKSGEMEKIYDKWFMRPIPPRGAKLGLPASNATKAAWASPNDRPLEDYSQR